MKVLFPRHIKKGLFSSLTFTIGPLTVSLIQLFVITIGLAGTFAIANYFIKNGNNKIISIAAGSPIALIAFAIAFFEVSEMSLLEFIAKMMRTSFFDTPTKYQVNVTQVDETDLLIKKSHNEEQTQIISFKTQKEFLNKDNVKDIQDSGFL